MEKQSMSVLEKKRRVLKLLNEGHTGPEICSIVGISSASLAIYKKDPMIQEGLAKVTASIIQKTADKYDSIGERRIDLALKAASVLEEIMCNKEARDQDRLKAAAYLVEPLTRYYQASTLTNTLSFSGVDSAKVMESISEIQEIFSKGKGGGGE